jgi:hypothetical protein
LGSKLRERRNPRCFCWPCGSARAPGIPVCGWSAWRTGQVTSDLAAYMVTSRVLGGPTSARRPGVFPRAAAFPAGASFRMWVRRCSPATQYATMASPDSADRSPVHWLAAGPDACRREITAQICEASKGDPRAREAMFRAWRLEHVYAVARARQLPAPSAMRSQSALAAPRERRDPGGRRRSSGQDPGGDDPHPEPEPPLARLARKPPLQPRRELLRLLAARKRSLDALVGRAP